MSTHTGVADYEAWERENYGDNSDDAEDDADAPEDELDRFLAFLDLRARPDFGIYRNNPILWWAERVRDYPRLSIMATDYLSIPAMTAETERLFSSCGRMTTPLRNHMDGDTIMRAQCLRSWAKEGIIRFDNIPRGVQLCQDPLPAQDEDDEMAEVNHEPNGGGMVILDD